MPSPSRGISEQLTISLQEGELIKKIKSRSIVDPHSLHAIHCTKGNFRVITFPLPWASQLEV